MPTDYDDDYDEDEEIEPLTPDQQECLKQLKVIAPEGTAIYTITRDVTEGENGDRWLISLHALGKDFYGQTTLFAITHHTCVLLELPLEAQRNTGDRGVVYESAGSDVGNDLVRLLAILAYGHPKAYKQVWL